MKSLNVFKQSLSELVDVCISHDYVYSFGYDSTNDSYMKISLNKNRGVIFSVVFDAIPVGFSCSVSIHPKYPSIYICVIKALLPP